MKDLVAAAQAHGFRRWAFEPVLALEGACRLRRASWARGKAHFEESSGKLGKGEATDHEIRR